MNADTNNSQKQVHVSPDIEKAVIAGLLSNPDAIFDVMGRLRPEMFYHPGLRFVYTSILSLVDAGKGVDMLTVEQEMIRLDMSQYERLNGLSFLSDMLLDVRNDYHIRYHADELVNNYILRRMQEELKKKETAVGGCDGTVERVGQYGRLVTRRADACFDAGRGGQSGYPRTDTFVSGTGGTRVGYGYAYPYRLRRTGRVDRWPV